MAYTTIDDGSAYFQTKLYTGTGSSHSITNDGNSDLQPDWVWIKCRSASDQEHNLYDSSRGTGKRLISSSNAAEDSRDGVTAFNSDGFTTNYSDANTSSSTYVAWQWKANGGTTSSNSSGNITSTNQILTTSGFGILTYTGFGEAVKTLGHNLGSVPDMMIFKSRCSSGGWFVYHKDVGNGKYLNLHSSDAATTDSNFLNNTTPTSSLITLGTSSAANSASATYVCYLFKSIQGYSKFGGYTGNGSTDGAFVYTGFKPAWIMIKRTDASKNWYMFNNKFSPFNVLGTTITANNNDAQSSEGSGTYVDFLSNGFKWRQDFSHANASGGEHIYMAFAEHPFVSSEGVPVTAR